jgi:hypothetical protein
LLIVQNTLEDVPLTIHKFWIIVGSATGAITFAGILLGLLFRFWRDVAGKIIKSPSPTQEQTLDQILGFAEPIMATSPAIPKRNPWTPNAIKSTRHRIPKFGGCVKGDDEEGKVDQGVSSGHETRTRVV